jgi:hypothetical protein
MLERPDDVVHDGAGVSRQKLGLRLQIRTREAELPGLPALLAVMLIVARSCMPVLWFERIA